MAAGPRTAAVPAEVNAALAVCFKPLRRRLRPCASGPIGSGVAGRPPMQPPEAFCSLASDNPAAGVAGLQVVSLLRGEASCMASALLL